MPETNNQEKSETKKSTKQIHVPKIVPPAFLADEESNVSDQTVTKHQIQKLGNSKNLIESEAAENEATFNNEAIVNDEQSGYVSHADKPASKSTNRRNAGKAEIPQPSNRLNEQKLARLLKREQLDLYSLQQVL